MSHVTDIARSATRLRRKLAGRLELRDKLRSWSWTRWVVLLVTPFVLFGSANAVGQQTKPDASQAVADSAAYLLIIDHSGSMKEKASTGKSRWEEMQARAAEFVRNVRPGSRIWLGVFSTKKPTPEIFTINTEQDRSALIQRIQKSHGPPQGATALYDTLGMAFEEAERLSQQNPNRYISVMVYTDGADEGSKEWSRESLQKRFNLLIAQNKNLWLFFTPLDKIPAVLDPKLGADHILVGEPKIPMSLRLVNDSFVLSNPKLQPKQTIGLEFLASDADWGRLDGKPMNFAFEAGSGQRINVRTASPSLKMRKGRIEVPVEVTNPNELKADEEYSGSLKITYPELEKHTVQASRFVRLSFQRQAPPKIFEFRPADGTTFAAGKPVTFWVSTLQGTKILWDFGDGSSGTGQTVAHVYNTPADRKVTLRVEADAAIGATKQEFTLHIIDVGVSIDPLPSPIMEGTQVKLTGTGRGEIQRYEWIIDGQKFDGRKTGSGAQTGSEITYTFDRSGKHVVSVVGYAEKAIAQSEERTLEVLRLGLAILQPQEAAKLYFGEKNRYSAQVDGPISEVAWTLRKISGGDPSAGVIHQITRPVTAAGESHVSEFEYTFGDATEGIDVIVEATGKLPDQLQLPPLTRTIAVRVEYAPLKATIEVENRPYAFNEGVQFKLVAPDGFQSVGWDFGDGDRVSDNPNPIHAYKQYGSFKVQATVTGKGGLSVTREATINVVRQPPQSRPKVTSGGRAFDALFMGSTIELVDESIGDIVSKAWLVNGQALPEGQLSVVMDQPGEQKITLRVAGPDVLDEKSVIFMVQKKREHILFVLAVIGSIIVLGFVWRIFSSNQPRAWRVQYAEAVDDFQDFKKVKVGDFWSYWFKRAEIPLAKMFRQSEHWKNSAGKRDVIVVGAPTPEGNISYPNRKHAQVNWATVPGTGQDKVYSLADSRAEEQFKQVYFRLQRTVTVSVQDAIIKVIVFLVLSGLVWYVWHMVYRSGS